MLLLAIPVSGVLFWLDRKEKAYLWLGITCFGITLQVLLTLTGNYTTLLPAWMNFMLSDAVMVPVVIALWTCYWAYWFRMGRMDRLQKMVWGFARCWLLKWRCCEHRCTVV